MADLQRATDEIWAAARRGEFYLPAWRRKLSVEEGYRVQLGLLERHLAAGDRHVGWKVGLTAKAIQEQIGYFEPVLGFLLGSGHWNSGCAPDFAGLISPCVETELCLTVGRTLKGPGITMAQARAALSAAAPAFELIERRGEFTGDLPLAFADNVQQKAFITGLARPLPPDVSLGATQVEVLHNGQRVLQAAGTEVMGDPAASVAWLANRLADFGRTLDAGMLVMSGSFTRQVPLAQGDRVEARFTPFGAVAASFP